MEETHVTCALCRKQISLKPSINFDDSTKEWWWDSKPYWTNRDSGKIYCDSCFGLIFLEAEYLEQEA